MSVIEYRGFKAEVLYDEEEEILTGKLIGIADTVIFDGKNVAEFEDMFHKAVDVYIERIVR